MAERLYILDAHSLIYQVFHAIPEMSSPTGQPTNAVFGFVRDIQILRRQKRPDYLVCAFDSPGATFRHDLFADYKVNRSEMPDDLRPQIAVIHKVLEAFRIPVLSEPGVEADDLLASVAYQCKDRGIEVYLCTADKDVRQCIHDCACVFDLRRNRVIDRAYLIEDWGISPEQVVDYQAMVGDSVDNVPGVAGIGPKTATQLLQKYGTLDAIYEHVDEIPQKGVREKLQRGRKSAFDSRELVKLRTDLELPDDWNGWRLQTPDVPELLRLFSECGFHRVVDEIRAEFPEQREWSADYELVATPEQFAGFLDALRREKRISIEIAMTSEHPIDARMVGIAICWAPGKAYYLCTRDPAGNGLLDECAVLSALREVLENSKIEKIGHNLKQERNVLRNYDIELRGVTFDTMIASYLLDPGERNHTLHELSERLLSHSAARLVDLVGNASVGSGTPRVEEVAAAKVAVLAGEHTDIAFRLAEILQPRLQAEGLWPLFETLECPLLEVLAEMEHTGIRVDAKLLGAQSQQFAGRLEQLEAKAHELAGRSFNLDSPKQLQEVLFGDLKLRVVKRTRSGPSTDLEVLEELAGEHPLCETIIEYRQLAKLKGTYLDALPTMIHPKTQRIHASFNQTVAATGRLSSSDPNLQNIPIRTEEGRQIRAAFIASDGNSLLAADYSQIELRLLAHYSGDPNLCQAFADDLDIHAVVAAQIAGVALDDVNTEMRRRAKAVNFGIMYGLSPYGLAKQLKIEQSDAALFIDSYFQQYPRIDEFITKTLESARKDRCVRTILGRQRPISGIKNTTGRNRNLPERTAINAVIQGSAADLIKQAMLRIHQRIHAEKLAARMLLQIHDELVFEVAEDAMASFARLVDQEMTDAIRLDVPLKVDIGVGPNWLDLEPLPAGVALSA